MRNPLSELEITIVLLRNHNRSYGISITKPSSDLCYKCQSNAMSLQKSMFLSEEEKGRMLESAQDHLRRAKSERDYYNQHAQIAVESGKSSGPRRDHYSYDFAQQLHYLYNAQQLDQNISKQHASVASLVCATMESPELWKGC